MKLNRTTQRTVEILKLVSKNPEGITLDEICEKLELPKTSAYDIVTTLAEMGMVNVDKGVRQRYTIGLTAYRIGIHYTNNLDVIGVIEPELRGFAKTVGKTVFFGVRSDHEVVYICKSEPENPIITTATVGTKNPMYCTSLGKAILAYSDEDIRNQVMGRIKFRKKTEKTILNRELLAAELDKVRKQGYALDARELIKVSVLKNCLDDSRELGQTLAERTNSEVVQVIGKKIVLYKQAKDEKKRKITLP